MADRLIFVWLYRLFPSLLGAAVIFQPETLVRWHRSGFRLYWRWKSGRRVGRPAIPAEIRNLVRTVSRDNPLWGAPRIHGELLKLGIDIAQSTVAKYMPRRHCPPSPGWRAFLRSHTAHIAAIDLFVVPTIGFKLLYGLVILRLERRRLVWTPLPRVYCGNLLDLAIAQRALRLSAAGPEMQNFWRSAAAQLGLNPDANEPTEDPAERERLRVELDVLVARDLFGLTRDEMHYLLDPADVLGADCDFETFGALQRAERRLFREFRTKRLIFEAWDYLTTNGTLVAR